MPFSSFLTLPENGSVRMYKLVCVGYIYPTVVGGWQAM